MSIHFAKGQKNQLLVNPKLGEAERKIFHELQKNFEEFYPASDFFFVASSGSSKKENESAKLIALPVDSVLNSAQRFNFYFKAESGDAWGLVLPTFHVAGLSVLARAYLARAEVISVAWQPQQMAAWLNENQIAFISLVPAQVFDLVQLKFKAPKFLKKVFVGAGSMNSALKSEFLSLGWPLVETYGMTETCSMVAVNESTDFILLPGVQAQLQNDLLQIHCDSLAHSSIQKIGHEIKINLFPRDWLPTEDQVVLNGNKLTFLGRVSDYVKILGEGVSLPELRSRLDSIASRLGIHPAQKHLLAVEEGRAENSLVLVVENAVDNHTADRLVCEFNQVVRGYEKIHKLVEVERIPRSDLGKVLNEDLKNLVLKKPK